MIAVIRVRGSVNIKPDIRLALESLNLDRPNHLVLVKEEKEPKKMVDKVKDYVTFGKIGNETLAALLEKRGRIEGDQRITPEFLKEKKVSDFADLASRIGEGKVTLKEMGIKRVFRLHPPKKGHARGGIKRPFAIGGALGNRGEKIDELIKKMM
ncbi:MAG: 50S ribosomal protein L30 [archaeon]|nr:50S ribosomal protein L30 [archaeon]